MTPEEIVGGGSVSAIVISVILFVIEYIRKKHCHVTCKTVNQSSLDIELGKVNTKKNNDSSHRVKSENAESISQTGKNKENGAVLMAGSSEDPSKLQVSIRPKTGDERV